MKIAILLLLAFVAYASARSTMCYSNGDPHFRGFAGRRFDNQYVGTILMAKTKYFEVQEKTIVWNRRTSVNQATGIKCGGHRIILSHRYNQVVKIDGRSYTLRNGKNIIKGIRFDKHGSRVFVRRGTEYVSVQVNYNRKWIRYGSTQYQNVAVFGHGSRVGICGTRRVRTGHGIWNRRKTVTVRKVVAKSHCSRKQYRVACKHCYNRFRTRKGRFYQWCVYDTCRGLRARWAASYAKQLKYWQTVVRKYNAYLKNHKRLAAIYYKRSLKHLEQMRIHGRKYRAHAKAAAKLRRQGNHHGRKYHAHKRAERHHRNKAHAHRRARNAHLKAHHSYKWHIKQWRSKIAHANRQIEKCEQHIENNENLIEKAEEKVEHYKKLAIAHLKNYHAHRKAANTHHKHANNHSRAAAKHWRTRNHYHRKANWHQKMTNHHLNLRQHHARHANANKRAFHAHKNAAQYWINKLKNGKSRVYQLTKLWQAQFKNEVKVVKTIQHRSRSCKTVPRYLDNIRFSSAAAAKAHALRRCNHGHRFVRYSCVFDHAKGLFHTKNQYARLAARESRNRKRLTCYSSGDPHNKPFIGRAFNVYNQKGWRVLLHKSKVTVWNHMSFTRTWGRRAINTYIQVKYNGKYTLFQPRGQIRRGGVYTSAGWRCQVNSRHRRQWVRTIGSTQITVSWHGHGRYPAGYYNVYVRSTKGAMTNCSGDCCNRHTKGAKRRDGNPHHVRFGSRCARKTTAYRVCAYAYRRYSGSRKVRAIRNCVNARRYL